MAHQKRDRHSLRSAYLFFRVPRVLEHSAHMIQFLSFDQVRICTYFSFRYSSVALGSASLGFGFSFFRLFSFSRRVLGSAERSNADLYGDKHTPRCNSIFFAINIYKNLRRKLISVIGYATQ